MSLPKNTMSLHWNTILLENTYISNSTWLNNNVWDCIYWLLPAKCIVYHVSVEYNVHIVSHSLPRFTYMPVFTKMARQYWVVMLSQYRVWLPTKKVVKVAIVVITWQGIAMYSFSGFADDISICRNLYVSIPMQYGYGYRRVWIRIWKIFIQGLLMSFFTVIYNHNDNPHNYGHHCSHHRKQVLMPHKIL